MQSTESITRFKRENEKEEEEKEEEEEIHFELTLCQALFYTFSYYGGK